MARPLRLEFAGALYHITSRGNERRPIFRDDIDREMFLTFLAEAVMRFGWSLTAYVLMTNHFHLTIQTPEPNLSRGMQWLNGVYVNWFNRRYKRSGHLFQGRFDAKLIEKENYFGNVLRYVVLNPVRAKIVSRPEDYRWSSYRATAGLEAAPAWLDIASALAWLHPDRSMAQAEYQRFVQAKTGCEDRLWDNLVNSIYLGSEEWAKRTRKIVESKPRSSDHPKVQRAVGRPAIQQVVETVARVGELPREVVRSRSGGAWRRLIAWIGWYEGLVTLRTIAAALRLRSEGYVSQLIRRCERELASDRRLLAGLDLALAALRN